VHHIVGTCGKDTAACNVFTDCRYVPQLQRHSPTKLYDGAEMAIFGEFLRPVFSAFQTFILNSHQGHTICGSTADIQSATAEIRRKKERRRSRKKEETTR